MIRDRSGGGVEIDLLVTARASRAKLGPVHGDRVKIAVCAPPVEGEANAAVIDAIARACGVPRSAVTILAGATGRRKTVAVVGVAVDTVLAAIAAG